MNGDPTLERIARGNGLALSAAGPWIARHAAALEAMVTDAEKLGGSRPNIFIDVSQVSRLDTFGAWLLERLLRGLAAAGCQPRVIGLADNYRALVLQAREVNREAPAPSRAFPLTAALAIVGRNVDAVGRDIVAIVAMLGALAAALGRAFLRTRTFRFTYAATVTGPLKPGCTLANRPGPSGETRSTCSFTSTPRSRRNGIGSVGAPFTWISRCRCVP